MNITAEEKLMYQVMKSIYDSGIPISFKGSMVLKACLLEAGYQEEIRHTVDIDASWCFDTPPSAEKMVESLQNSMDRSGIELKVNIYRMYRESRSAGFELRDTFSNDIIFTMDIDINKAVYPTKIYEVEGVRFCGVVVSQIIADKVSAISTNKVFQRIKDVVDLYYISKVFKFDKADIIKTLKECGRTLNTFDGFLNRMDDLRHAYEKFRFTGDVVKPSFEEVYSTVKTYIIDILPKEK